MCARGAGAEKISRGRSAERACTVGPEVDARAKAGSEGTLHCWLAWLEDMQAQAVQGSVCMVNFAIRRRGGVPLPLERGARAGRVVQASRPDFGPGTYIDSSATRTHRNRALERGRTRRTASDLDTISFLLLSYHHHFPTPFGTNNRYGRERKENVARNTTHQLPHGIHLGGESGGGWRRAAYMPSLVRILVSLDLRRGPYPPAPSQLHATRTLRLGHGHDMLCTFIHVSGLHFSSFSSLHLALCPSVHISLTRKTAPFC